MTGDGGDDRSPDDSFALPTLVTRSVQSTSTPSLLLPRRDPAPAWSYSSPPISTPSSELGVRPAAFDPYINQPQASTSVRIASAGHFAETVRREEERRKSGGKRYRVLSVSARPTPGSSRGRPRALATMERVQAGRKERARGRSATLATVQRLPSFSRLD